MDSFILTLSCPDRLGIVHAVTGFLAEHNYNIVDSQQFGDRDTGRFFMRVHVEGPDSASGLAALRTAFTPIGETLAMDWQIHDGEAKPRIIVMVSKQGHCLNDLLYRCQIGALPARIVSIVSNHREFEALANAYGVTYHYVPVTRETKPDAERRLLELVTEEEAELVVLARYMQVLSDTVCTRLAGRIINIHHSFLPSFKGAKPYHQAHNRGVKVIGATAHYVTANLDEGPIIEQEVARVNHADGVEHRVLVDGHKTIVFR